MVSEVYRQLNINTSIQNTAWLEYILEEFRRTQGANFKITINQVDSNAIQLEYSDNGDIPLHYLDCTKIISKRTECSISDKLEYDIFWNAFYYISRFEEYTQEKKGNRIKSYSVKLQNQCSFNFQFPIVNVIFQNFEDFLKQKHSLTFAASKKPILDIGHDLDYVRKTPQLRIKQSVFHLYNGLKFLRPTRILKSFTFLFNSSKYWMFDYWTEIEQKYGLHSTYFIFAKTNLKSNFKQWLIDPSYSISDDAMLQRKLLNLKDKGHKIGLHGSYFSALNSELMKAEIKLLQDVLKDNITLGRQHWLNYETNLTDKIHEEFFTIDYTIGWNDIMGYRAGTCSLFRPYNHVEQRAFEYFCVPQLIMDSHIYDYGYPKIQLETEKALNLISEFKSYKNGRVSISWHPRTAHKDYLWTEAFEKILKIWNE